MTNDMTTVVNGVEVRSAEPNTIKDSEMTLNTKENFFYCPNCDRECDPTCVDCGEPADEICIGCGESVENCNCADLKVCGICEQKLPNCDCTNQEGN